MNNTDVVKVDQIPEIIENHFNSLERLRNKVNEANKNVAEAQKCVDEACHKVVRFYNKGQVIESLQEAVSKMYKAQSDEADAQMASFEYQQKLCEVIKFSLGLGLTNIAMNRMVVEQLKRKLAHASEEKLDEFARKEIMELINQLKAQEDILEKHKRLSEIVKSQSEQIKNIEGTLITKINQKVGKRENIFFYVISVIAFIIAVAQFFM